MLDKETYKREYIRMMDSVREKFKGNPNCNGVNCSECDVEEICGHSSLAYNAFEIIEAVEKWAKEHPVKTNADKFKEVFGVEPSLVRCPLKRECRGCEYKCELGVTIKFWNSEYKEPEKEKE